MPAITATDLSGVLPVAVTETTLDGTTDTLVFNSNKTPKLVLINNTGGALSPVIAGDGSTTVDCNGVGAVDVSSFSGFGSIADGATKAISLSKINEYLRGTITITGGTGLTAQLLEY